MWGKDMPGSEARPIPSGSFVQRKPFDQDVVAAQTRQRQASDEAASRKRIDDEQLLRKQEEEAKIAEETRAAEQAPQNSGMQADAASAPDLGAGGGGGDLFGGLFSSLGGLIGGKGGAGGGLGGLLGMIPKLLQMLPKLLQSLFGGLGGLFGGGAGIGSMFGFLHEGGMASDGAATKMVNPAVFQHAIRMHTGGVAGGGLAPNEVPRILDKTEEVLTKGDPRHIRNLGKGGGQNPAGKNAVHIVNVFDPGDAVKAGLSTPHGADSFINFIRDNSESVKGALG
jgi:hypothetical protein